jgi:hypothetical protein
VDYKMSYPYEWRSLNRLPERKGMELRVIEFLGVNIAKIEFIDGHKSIVDRRQFHRRKKEREVKLS